ncbi:hypothetical protein Drorol1_Dr00027672 [Drosera rotundifolia]
MRIYQLQGLNNQGPNALAQMHWPNLTQPKPFPLSNPAGPVHLTGPITPMLALLFQPANSLKPGLVLPFTPAHLNWVAQSSFNPPTIHFPSLTTPGNLSRYNEPGGSFTFPLQLFPILPSLRSSLPSNSLSFPHHHCRHFLGTTTTTTSSWNNISGAEARQA